jgi:indole-3-glycerol phosphate synthase
MDILETIVAHKRKEIAMRKKAVPLNTLLASAALQLQRPVSSMRRALEQSPSGIIAEFKRKSPSKGWLHPDAKVEKVVSAYEVGGAAACSVLTDETFFGGSLHDLCRARELVRLPLLRKDFMVDEYQLYEARAAGADAILLIASMLNPDECRQLAQKAHELNMNVLLEVHSENELSRLNPCVDMLGVNNRNLGTFDTSVQNSFRLLEKIKKEVGESAAAPLLVSESGLSDEKTIKELRSAGFRGFLIGEAFMKTASPGKALNDLICRLSHEQNDC